MILSMVYHKGGEQIILDTNVWIALFKQDDTQHTKAETIFRSFDTHTRLLIPEYILLEVSSILLFKIGKRIVGDFIASFLRTSRVSLLYSSQKLCDTTLILFYEQAEKKLSFVDCALLSLSQTYRVITFDEKLQTKIKENKK